MGVQYLPIRSHTFVSVFQHMLCKLCGTLERFVTLHTDKDPPSTGLFLVKLQLSEMAEVFAATCATVGFLFAVDKLVTNQAGRHCKCHTALSTLERPHSTVNGFMFGQVRGFSEAFGTHGADIWTHSLVDFLVLGHTTGEGKCFSTVRTGERPFPQVLTLVTLQGQGFIEGLAAVCTWERLVIDVHVSLMLPEVRGADEILATSVTRVAKCRQV